MVQLLQIMQLNSTPIVGMIGPQSNEVTNLLAFSSSVGMPFIMVSVITKMHNDKSTIAYIIHIVIIINMHILLYPLLK